jgi:hypothetical protein
MIDFFKDMWNLQMQELNFLIDYWYVWTLLIAVCFVILWLKD